jgi:hypothetical protein
MHHVLDESYDARLGRGVVRDRAGIRQEHSSVPR